MKVTIDRFEGDFAVLELPDRKMIDIKRDKIPAEAKEGDVLQMDGDKITIDEEETLKRKTEIEELMDDIWK